MKYIFDAKNQTLYGIVGFLLALIILYFVANEVNLIVSVIIGICDFIVSGFYNKK